MKIVEWLKELVFELTHTPNSPEGLRHRADRLVKEGVDENSSYVQMLRKRANFAEERKEKKQC